MQEQLLSANPAETSLSPDRSHRSGMSKRSGVVGLGLLAAGGVIGFLGSSTRGLLATRSVLSMDAQCHPWDGRTATIYVNGYGSGVLDKWLSHNDDGHWMIARYNRRSDAAPWYFRAAPNCGEYYLQDVWPGLSFLDHYDDHWLSFTNSGQWVRANYASSDAVPIKFIAEDDGTYKMQNKWSGDIGDVGGHDPDHLYFSYTNGDYSDGAYTHPERSVRTIYTEADAMKVNLLF